MKKQLLFLLITILSINCYSQITFEKGYYINNTNQKVDCLIKNIDWKNNPTEFEYKLTENSGEKKATIETIKEFGIYNMSKYSRHIVEIDKSSNDIINLSLSEKAIFQKEEVFLKVLIEGKSNLYLYENGNLERYFYSKKDSKIEQLIFKQYLNDDNKIATNNRYRQQLWSNLQCSNFKMSKFEYLEYKKNELIHFFEDYNKCHNQEYVTFESKQKKDLFNLNVRLGFNNSSLSIQEINQTNASINREIKFNSEFEFRIGIETEFIFPFNKNKWSAIIEPTYQHYSSEKELISQNVTVNYKSIEIPVGIRHYLFLNENSKLFINGSLLLNFSINSDIVFDSETDLKIRPRPNLGFGLGYKYKDKYSLEFRYLTRREILKSKTIWTSDYNTLSFIFGYSIF